MNGLKNNGTKRSSFYDTISWALNRFTQIADRLIGIALALLLFHSAFAHSDNPYYFLSTVYSYRILDPWTGAVISGVVPFVQLILAVCLVTRTWPQESYLAATLLFFTFGAAQLLALRRLGDKVVSCGCFGANGRMTLGNESLVLVASALGVSLIGIVLNARSISSPSSTATQNSPSAS